MEWESDERELKAAGAELLPEGRRGLRIHGWEIESRRRSILTSLQLQQWEEELQTSHLPEMVFGDNSLVLKHVNTGTEIHFNAFDALVGWKREALPPVEVPAAEKWKFRSKPLQKVVLDYDYTFTTPYSGSETFDTNAERVRGLSNESSCSLQWEDCTEKIDLVALASKEPILFYDEIILYEDELADNGISLLTVKVRVMPSGWFLLLRFWLRVDGVLMRLRDTRLHCLFGDHMKSVILRESSWREATFQALSSKGYPSDCAAYSDPSTISERLPIIMQKTQKLSIEIPLTCCSEQLRKMDASLDSVPI
nr:TIP41-like protein isoform X1 [Nicotiana tomentosiformis]